MKTARELLGHRGGLNSIALFNWDWHVNVSGYRIWMDVLIQRELLWRRPWAYTRCYLTKEHETGIRLRQRYWRASWLGITVQGQFERDS